MRAVKERILDEVNNMIHYKGFKGITFLSLAEKISTSRENIHHHFRTKEKLGLAYLGYLKLFLENHFSEVHQSKDSMTSKLEAYYEIYRTPEEKQVQCPIVSLLNEYQDLPSSMQEGIKDLVAIEFENVKKILNETHDVSENEVQVIIMLLKGTVLYEKTHKQYFDETIIYVEKILRKD